MKKYYFSAFLSSVLLAAHFSRIENDWMALTALLLPAILFHRRRWVLRIYQLYLIAGGIIWFELLFFLQKIRTAEGRPWFRLAVILAVVALFTWLSAFLLNRKKVLSRFPINEDFPSIDGIALSAFLLSGGILTITYLKVELPLLLLERFFPGSAPLQIALISFYAGWLSEKMADIKRIPLYRRRIWMFFSIIFFTQFGLGLMGIDKFLMTGTLHLPIPALIIGGPLFRGGGLFMLILFVSTVFLAGSAWCSHLCYIGAWDNAAAANRTRPVGLYRSWKYIRFTVLAGIIVIPLILRFAGIGSRIVIAAAVLYGLGGLSVMAFISRKKGVMVHCTLYCPIGLAADLLGKISRFRIRFTQACDSCGECITSCRYNALTAGDIKRRRVGLSCTLCGDCLAACPSHGLEYKIIGLSPRLSRKIFLVFVISLHAVFLAVARI